MKNQKWSAIISISSKIGCTAETLRRWVRRIEIDSGKRGGLTSDARGRFRELERENRELRIEFEETYHQIQKTPSMVVGLN